MSDTGRAPRVPGLEDFERIGSGGFSTVYRAYDPQFDRVVAVKILNLAVSDPDAQRKFLRECRLMGRLGSHPHVLTVFAADVLPDDRPYIVMEYLEGGTVADLAPLPQDEVLRTGILVGSALASVHAADVVHRDVKPQNILLSAYGQPVLGDFGVSGVVQQDGSVSTPTALSPLYAAPEAFHGIPDQASDQYSLGATLYALLAGRSPADVGAEGPFPQIMLRVLEHDASPLPPTVADPRLAKVVHRALAKAPQDRFPDVAALVDALQQVQRDLGLPVTASVAAPTPTARREQIGEGARISTRPPLGGARTPGTGAPATEPPVAGDHTVPVGWPSTPVDADEAPHFADATHDKSSRMPDSETMGATRTTPPPAPVDAAGTAGETEETEADDGGRRSARRGVLLPVMVVLALGVAVALVVLVIRAPVPDDDPIQAQPTAISLMREGPEPADPSAPLSYLLTWGGGEDEEWYVVRYSEDDPGSPAAVEAEGYDGMSLTVVVEDAVGTCFFVASEADRERLTAAGLDPSRAELRSDDGCVGTTATVVGGA